ncbi:MAG: N-acetylmuramoyl-L-alanine amidase [Sphingomonadales bacterium]|nr:N-acetylmuramoyl-L-alanine amidase [Sphingomonadales bacterium]
MTYIQTPSPNHDERTLPVDMLIMHYTGMQSGPDALERLRDPQWRVSAHYLVEEDGRIFQLVDEERRARHAGVSFWCDEVDTNSRSIGIEIVNPGHEWGYRAFPDEQIKAVIALSQDIMTRHTIPSRFVLGHSDVAPSRKTDPGELFPWGHLADNGIGISPPNIEKAEQLLTPLGAASMSAEKAQILLSWIGYNIEPSGIWDEHCVISMTAFQRHFHPARLDGLVDEGGMAALEHVAAAMDAAQGAERAKSGS